MKSWKTAARCAALLTAAVAIAGFGAPVQGQARIERGPRALEGFAGRGSEIGVSIRDVESDSKSSTPAAGAAGVVIVDVTTDGPADKAGIKKGDVVVEFDGERVRSARQFSRLVQETPPGRRVSAAVTRAGQRVTVTVEPRAGSPVRLLGDWDGERMMAEIGRNFEGFPVPPVPPPAPRPDRAPAPPSPPAAPAFPDIDNFIWRGDTGLGLTVSTLSSQLADYFGARRGVLVTAVQDGSAAHSAGFKAGDVVTTINGDEVTQPADLRRTTQRLRDGDEFTAEVVREKKTVTLKGKMERRSGGTATRISI